jgi:hypothetical protein
MSNEIFKTYVQIRRPDGADPGQVALGAYTIENDLLTMVQPDGSPVRNPINGETFKAKLRDGDNSVAIAGQLTLEIRQALLGKGTVAGFNRQLDYPKSGLA